MMTLVSYVRVNLMGRNWALYLGRPYSIKLNDVSVPRPGCNTETPSWDMLMSAAWTNLLEIVGHICDAL